MIDQYNHYRPSSITGCHYFIPGKSRHHRHCLLPQILNCIFGPSFESAEVFFDLLDHLPLAGEEPLAEYFRFGDGMEEGIDRLRADDEGAILFAGKAVLRTLSFLGRAHLFQIALDAQYNDQAVVVEDDLGILFVAPRALVLFLGEGEHLRALGDAVLTEAVQVVHYIILMIVIESQYNPNNKQVFQFQGEADVQAVKFNHTASPKLIAFAASKEANKDNLAYFVWEAYPELKELIKSESTERSVCAKIVHNGETIVECMDCRMDESCIICLDCFKKGNHTGHKILYKKAYGGCCDCGDSEAWDPKGFCSSHSGQVQDVDIDQATVAQFTSIMQDIFYIYYRFKLRRENQRREQTYLTAMQIVIERIVSDGPKGIKLIALFLQSRLPDNLKFNAVLQGDIILYHLFTWSFISRDLNIWEHLFIKMFPYYQFKKQLLAAYIECYPRIYVSEEACMTGQSISCQILTSYKLVEDYIDSHHSQPLCYNIGNITDQLQINCISSMLFTDLEKISNLQEPVPHKYMRLQALSGVNMIFAYHALINSEMANQKKIVSKANEDGEKKANKKKKKKNTIIAEEALSFFNHIYYMIKNSRQSFNEHSALEIFNILLRTIKNDENSLLKVLKECASLIDSDSDDLIIFRVYDRAFALTLFTLCQQRLQKLQDPQLRNLIMATLQKGQEQFENWLANTQMRMLKTYFFYCHIICNENRGYHSSFQNYIYLYRGKDQLMVSTDIIQLKAMALLRKTPLVLDFPSILRFADFDQEKWNFFILSTMYNEMQMIYTSKFAQIYVSHYDLSEKDTSELKGDAIQYLAKFVAEEGNTVSLEKITKYCKSYLFNNTERMKIYLRECCTYSKEKRMFELMQQFRSELPLKYIDLDPSVRDNILRNKSNQQDQPRLTLAMINGYNRAVLEHYWNEGNTETIKQVIVSLYEEMLPSGVQEHLMELAILECKICMIIKQFWESSRDIVIKELLLRAPISAQISQKLVQYKDILGSSEVQAQTKMLQKKELLRLKKLKKMEQIKKKNSENMSAIRQVHTLQEEINVDEVHCSICKKKESEKFQLVYLVSLNVRNMEKLCKLGPGVQTLSVTTCYHLFDYDCIVKEAKNDHQGGLKCPVCRRVGNLYMPAHPSYGEQSRPFIIACLERVTQIMMMIHNYQQIDPIEQLFKCFYHFVLLYQYEEQYVRKRRTKIYSIILQMLQHSSLQQHMLQIVAAKFLSNEISLNPKVYKKDKVTILSLKEEEYDMDSFSQDDDEENEDYMILSQPREQPKKKSQDNDKSPKKNIVSQVFKYVGLRILKNIVEKKNGVSQKKSEMAEEKVAGSVEMEVQGKCNEKKEMEVETYYTEGILEKTALPEVDRVVQAAIDQLFGVAPGMKDIEIEPPRIQLAELPKSFYWDMSKNTCDVCKKTCHDLFICLLCPWKGCLSCPRGGVSRHFPLVHGETSVFMRLNDGIIYQVGNKLIKKIGCAYLNEWGEQLKLKKDWESYVLQEQVLQKARNLLLRDQ